MIRSLVALLMLVAVAAHADAASLADVKKQRSAR